MKFVEFRTQRSALLEFVKEQHGDQVRKFDNVPYWTHPLTVAEMVEHLELGPVLLGCLVAGVSAALAVRWLVGFLSRRGLALFAWYRIVLAAVIFAMIGMDILV